MALQVTIEVSHSRRTKMEVHPIKGEKRRSLTTKKQSGGNPHLKHVCDKLMDCLKAEYANTDNRMESLSVILQTYVDKLDYSNYYYSVVDFLFWIGGLDKFCKSNAIKEDDVISMAKRFFVLLKSDIETKRDVKRIDEIFATQLAEDKIEFAKLFEIILPICEYNAVCFCLLRTKTFLGRFYDFIFDVFQKQKDDFFCFDWLHQTYLYHEHFTDTTLEKVIYYEYAKNKNGWLIELCKTDQSKKLAERVVAYLDKFIGSFNSKIDPKPTEIVKSNFTSGLKGHRKELIKAVFEYQKLFDLDRSLIENTIFVRHMNTFFYIYHEFRKHNASCDFFHETVINIMSEGGQRVQSAIMRFLCGEGMRGSSIQVALKMEIPRKDWPNTAKKNKQDIEMAKSRVDEWKKKLSDGYEAIKNGFDLLKDGTHTAYIVDSQDKIDKWLRPFIEESECFGYDSEWVMSYCGNGDTLCLIQMSNATQTMLIDIHAFKNQLKWTDDQFLDLFKLIFNHEKKIYGYGLLNDIKVLHRNFPIFKEQISPNLNNLTCLYETTKVVKNDENLAKLFFNDDVPEKLKLSNVTEALLGSPLDKREATSIWSSRPLRFDQLVYAAMDSFTVVKLEKFIREKIQGNCPDKVDVVFVPLQIFS